MEILDLDVLRPEPKKVKLAGKELDLSFLPLAITFDVAAIIDKLNGLDADKLGKNDPAEVRKAFDLGVELCVVFCQHQYPEMDLAWFNKNTTVVQVNKLVDGIKGALALAYEGIPEKN